MKQKTAKTIEDVLEWIENNPHHYASTMDEEGFFILKGKDIKLRIPVELYKKCYKYIKSNDNKFDTRMFRATKQGLKLLSKTQ